jgi:UDP-GlcNAc3NAcA epimerase
VAAAKLYIPVAHVEAGLRSFQQMPEEINRIVADRLSRWLFCPTKTAVANLASEGITDGVHLVGDVMFDATLRVREQVQETSTILADLGLKSNGFQVATLHRAENTDTAQALTTALDYLKAAACTCPVVLPLHPRTRAAAKRFGLSFDGLTTVSPVGFVDMAALLDGCVQVLTDSGGLQKEAYFHGKPCVTMRDATEWTETIDAGWNRLWHTQEFRPRQSIDAYGQGDTALRIVEILARGA